MVSINDKFPSGEENIGIMRGVADIIVVVYVLSHSPGGIGFETDGEPAG